jgi:hypothetical protein
LVLVAKYSKVVSNYLQKAGVTQGRLEARDARLAQEALQPPEEVPRVFRDFVLGADEAQRQESASNERPAAQAAVQHTLRPTLHVHYPPSDFVGDPSKGDFYVAIVFYEITWEIVAVKMGHSLDPLQRAVELDAKRRDRGWKHIMWHIFRRDGCLEPTVLISFEREKLEEDLEEYFMKSVKVEDIMAEVERARAIWYEKQHQAVRRASQVLGDDPEERALKRRREQMELEERSVALDPERLERLVILQERLASALERQARTRNSISPQALAPSKE